MITTDIFLRSFSGDLAWVPWALKSIAKFVTGIRDIIIVVPANDYDRFKSLNFTRELLCSSRLEPFKDDYLGQQADKLMADLYTDADCIIYWDSDCIATRKFKPEDLFVDGTPRWLMTPYSKLVKPGGSPDTPWQPITEKAIAHPVAFEFMRAHPFIVPWDALSAFRRFMQSTHGCSVREYIEKQAGRSFSEWNALGAWAYYDEKAHDRFYWWNTETDGVPEPFVHQFWSWGGLRNAEREALEKFLSGQGPLELPWEGAKS